jgi:hypothetical protein
MSPVLSDHFFSVSNVTLYSGLAVYQLMVTLTYMLIDTQLSTTIGLTEKYKNNAKNINVGSI